MCIKEFQVLGLKGVALYLTDLKLQVQGFKLLVNVLALF